MAHVVPRARRAPWLALTLSIGALGCGAPSAGSSSAGSSTEAPLASTDPTSDSSEVGAPDVSAVEAALDARSRAALAEAPFAALVLPARWSSHVMSGPHWVAVTAHQDGVHVALHGTDVARDVVSEAERSALPAPTTFVRGQPALVTVNEQIRSVAWTEQRIAWALEVECAQPSEDARCTDPSFALSLAESLVRMPAPIGVAR